MSKLLVDQIEKRTGGTAMNVPAGGKWTATELADDSVGSDQIAGGAVDTVQLATDAVGIAELSATGTASATTFLRGDNAWASAAAGLASVQTFTSSGTWTRPSGITKVIMEVQGAGGGGCKGSSYHQGGAGGGYAKKFLDVSSIGTSTITVGAGGAGAANGVTGSGTVGGNSIWADGTNTITGSGGAPGTDVNAFSVGGTGTGGDINIPGQINGQNPNQSGDSVLGYGGTAANSADAPTAAKSGQGYGGGGSAWAGYAIACGSGSGGIVIVWEYK